MGAFKGTDFLVKIRDGASYYTIAGMRATAMKINNETVDIHSKSNTDNWRELLSGAAIEQMTISMSGVFLDDASEGYALASAINKTKLHYKLHASPIYPTSEYGNLLYAWPMGDTLINTYAADGYGNSGSFSYSTLSSGSYVQFSFKQTDTISYCGIGDLGTITGWYGEEKMILGVESDGAGGFNVRSGASQISLASGTYLTTDVFKVEKIGTTGNVYKNDSLVVSVVDNDLSQDLKGAILFYTDAAQVSGFMITPQTYQQQKEWSGYFVITNYERAGDNGKEETYDMTLESAGPISYQETG